MGVSSLQLFTFFFGVALSGCQTLSPPIEVVMPATIDSLFDSCAKGDGAISLTAKKAGDLLLQTEFEWIAHSERDWTVEIYSPIGQTVFKLAYQGTPARFQVTSANAAAMPHLSVDDQGFIELDGHFVPLKATEVPCLLKYKLPRGWREIMRVYRREGNQAKMTAIDRERTIDITIEGIASFDNRHICSVITWRHFLGLVKSQVNICQKLGKSPSAKIDGLKDYEINWSSAP